MDVTPPRAESEWQGHRYLPRTREFRFLPPDNRWRPTESEPTDSRNCER